MLAVFLVSVDISFRAQDRAVEDCEQLSPAFGITICSQVLLLLPAVASSIDLVRAARNIVRGQQSRSAQNWYDLFPCMTVTSSVVLSVAGLSSVMLAFLVLFDPRSRTCFQYASYKWSSAPRLYCGCTPGLFCHVLALQVRLCIVMQLLLRPCCTLS